MFLSHMKQESRALAVREADNLTAISELIF
jgi:hypothetical protein